MTAAVPRRATNLSNPITHELVYMNETISICIILVVTHVKRKQHRFSEVLLIETQKGSEESTPHLRRETGGNKAIQLEILPS